MLSNTPATVKYAEMDGAHLAGSPARLSGQPGSTLRVYSSSSPEWQVQQPIIAAQVRKLLHHLPQITGQRDLHIKICWNAFIAVHSSSLISVHACISIQKNSCCSTDGRPDKVYRPDLPGNAEVSLPPKA